MSSQCLMLLQSKLTERAAETGISLGLIYIEIRTVWLDYAAV